VLKKSTVMRALAFAGLWLGASAGCGANDFVVLGYTACVKPAWPTIDDAEQRITDCSTALQSRLLNPDGVALARLTRGAARFALGQKQVASEDFREALRHYDGAIDPRNPDALNVYRRGVAHEGLGNTTQALEEYSQAIRLDADKALPYFDRGVLLATRARSLNRAIDDFNRALELQPDNVQALVARGAALGELGQNARALADLDHAVEHAPRSSEAHHRRAIVRGRLGDVTGALEDYATALDLQPRNYRALVDRAGLRASLHDYELAIRDLSNAIGIRSDEASAFYNRGYAYFATGRYDKAILDYDLAIAIDPAFAAAYNNRCVARAVAGKELVKALSDCDIALKLSPLNLDVRATRGFVFLKLGDPQMALNEYNALLDRDPNRPVALYGRGLALMRIGKPKQGEREMAAARAIDPEIADSFARYQVN
jgi:tetratricopeptide (TPR) repeat protein